MHISPITELTPSRETAPATSGALEAGAGASGVSFGDVFSEAINTANRTDAFASQKVDALARGFGDDLHGTMIAVKEADISVKLVATVRNKLLDAFNEIWRTSV